MVGISGSEKKGGYTLSHDGWLSAVTLCCSKVLLQFLYFSGGFVGCSWSKVKSIAFQVSAPALEISLGFGIWAWFISSFLASIIIELGGLSLVPGSWGFQFIFLRWAGWYQFDHSLTFP